MNILTVLQVTDEGGDDGGYGIGVIGTLVHTSLVDFSTLNEERIHELFDKEKICFDYNYMLEDEDEDDPILTISEPEFDKTYSHEVNYGYGVLYFRLTPVK